KINRKRDIAETLIQGIEICRKRMADHFRLFEDFLRHEMPMIALVHDRGGNIGNLDRALDGIAFSIMDHRTITRDLDAVAFFQKYNAVRHRCERKGIGTEIHAPFAIAYRERAPPPRTDHQIFIAAKNDAEREGTLKLLDCKCS